MGGQKKDTSKEGEKGSDAVNISCFSAFLVAWGIQREREREGEEKREEAHRE
jgi:hypothetical protein